MKESFNKLLVKFTAFFLVGMCGYWMGYTHCEQDMRQECRDQMSADIEAWRNGKYDQY